MADSSGQDIGRKDAYRPELAELLGDARLAKLQAALDREQMIEMGRTIALQHESAALAAARLAELEAATRSEHLIEEIELLRVHVEEWRNKLDMIELTVMVKRLGVESVMMERVITEWSKANVPQFVGDSDLAQALLQVMPFAQARDMLLDMAKKQQRPATGSSPTAADKGEG